MKIFGFKFISNESDIELSVWQLRDKILLSVEEPGEIQKFGFKLVFSS
jgi:hypothetical protein